MPCLKPLYSFHNITPLPYRRVYLFDATPVTVSCAPDFPPTGMAKEPSVRLTPLYYFAVSATAVRTCNPVSTNPGSKR